MSIIFKHIEKMDLIFLSQLKWFNSKYQIMKSINNNRLVDLSIKDKNIISFNKKPQYMDHWTTEEI